MLIKYNNFGSFFNIYFVLFSSSIYVQNEDDTCVVRYLINRIQFTIDVGSLFVVVCKYHFAMTKISSPLNNLPT